MILYQFTGIDISFNKDGIHTSNVGRFFENTELPILFFQETVMKDEIYRLLFISKYPDNTLHHLLLEAGEYCPYNREIKELVNN